MAQCGGMQVRLSIMRVFYLSNVKCRNGKVRVKNSFAGLEFIVDKKNDKFVLSKGHPR